ncbi:fungal-specific transcription factor domain-containing protein [Boeremia exigua]|uniref:fungal-specific transcription factor domain-containing protein n=1 Tax=Boeremia exigua TaxID=749465 RepID=UPI001E8EF191|nr:fungal-specific transcription factor domain-containing protein [Boeremia exigua]KAH6643502.1 fungal-specific transcription factor domain-containing protein [Boeremia exigua]
MPSPSPSDMPKPGTSRASVACDACRKRKVKCSGNVPCVSCQRRSIQCTVAEDSRRIVVSERYLQSLHLRLRRFENATRASVGTEDVDEVEAQFEEDNDLSLMRVPEMSRNELTEQVDEDSWEADLSESPFPDDTSFIKDNRSSEARWLYVAQSSSWSFVFRVTDLLQEATTAATEELRFPLDGDAYPLRWDHIQESNWLRSIPPRDYAIYLLNSVKFHLSHRLQFFDHEAFATKTAEFYNSPLETARSSRLWCVQFLVIMAFGKALLERPRNHIVPSGFEFFARGMSLLTCVPELQRTEPILTIEVLALIALYMYCIDYKASAYAYIGQAARLAMHSGLHTRLPVERFGVEIAHRYNCLWWSIYIMDRHIASATGCPTVVHEEDITAPLPITFGSSQRHIVYTLHVKVSRLVSKVLSTVYVSNNAVDRTFLERTRRLLKSLAGLAKELEDTIQNQLQSPIQVDLASVTLLTLAYHECAILATRPVLLSLLKRRLKNGTHHQRSMQQNSDRPNTLVDTCANSAAKIIELLTVRLDNNMIEVFLPFQLDTLSSALIVLLVIRAVSFTTHNVLNLEERAHAIFDEMIAQKNPIAKYRKAEAVHVKELLASLDSAARLTDNKQAFGLSAALQRPQSLNSIAPEHPAFSNDFTCASGSSDFATQFSTATFPVFPMVPNDVFLMNFGLSSEALEYVANQVMFDSPLSHFASMSASDGQH